VGYKFSLVLSREINDEESSILQGAVPADPIFGTDSLPTDAEITVTKMEFDDTVSPSLADAIESALDAVKKVPDLSVPGLTVPAQPAGPPAEDPPVLVGEVVEDDLDTKKATASKPAARKPAAKKASTRKPPAKKASKDATPVEAGAGRR
jgi:hypothetical protein